MFTTFKESEVDYNDLELESLFQLEVLWKDSQVERAWAIVFNE